MDALGNAPKMVKVEADQIESVGFIDSTHTMYIKFRNSPAMCFEKVPRFRYQGLLAAPRKDAYYRTFIQNQFMTKPANV